MNKLFHNQDEVMENIMLFAPMNTLSAIQDSFTESMLADMDAEDAEIFEESQSVHVRKSRKSHYDKKAMRRKGSPKRFRDRSRKCAHEGHVWKTYSRGLSGDCAERGKRLEKTGRPQRVNVHFTNGATLDTFDMSEADVFQTWSADSQEYSSMDSFFEYMDNMDWARIPSTVRFLAEWNANDPFYEDCWYSPDYFGMSATLKKGRTTVTAEKAREEYEDFKKCFQTFRKYGEKLRALQQEMRNELLR